MDNVLHFGGDLLGVLVLPAANDDPACFEQPPIGIGIAPSVIRPLGGPPGGVRVGVPRMAGTSVPEAPVHEDGHSLPWERDIDPAARRSGDRLVEPVPEATSVQRPPHGQLWRRVLAHLRLHP
jgi:hypothetical protein